MNVYWSIILKLYTSKNINPAEELEIYTEDTDAGVSEISDSQIPSSVNYTKDSRGITNFTTSCTCVNSCSSNCSNID
jgi:hypothetical protein